MSFTDVLLAGMMIIVPAVSNLPENKTAAKECLAVNMYHEARDQGTAGRLAVSAVVLNRVRDRRFPNTVCEVVYQAQMKPSWKTGEPVPIRNRCQFSWYCDGKSDKIKDKKTYQKILDFAGLILHNDIEFLDITDGATHYHADYVKPDWAGTKTRTTEIGDHIFYRWEKK
jgi:N-acetylmuramoyl-L-alanine amidase|tara:strand:- start:233 stop:742 length:510 start_codon:yes stop_codon:yes gene_type:complete